MNINRIPFYSPKIYSAIDEKYYNGWQNDLPEPNWTLLASTLPASCQVFRDIDGNYYHNSGYQSGVWYKRDANLVQVGNSLSATTKYNRGYPYIITNYSNTGKDVMVFPGYWGNTPVFIDLSNFSILPVVGFPAGYFIDVDGDLSLATSVDRWAMGGGGVVYNNGNTILSLGLLVVWGDFRPNAIGKLAVKYTCLSGLGMQSMAVGDGFICFYKYTATSNNLIICDYNMFLETFDIDASLLRTVTINTPGETWEAFYIYNNYLVSSTFSGACYLTNLLTGEAFSTVSLGGSNQSTFWWKNKIYRTGQKTVTTLSI
ncbi:MAG: hypothetical protein LBT27_06400 [Prevotellaceae bacterium]|jgi:hypothetical protein|nr:hypothetical protein [Prevotellaceae bacterium]